MVQASLPTRPDSGVKVDALEGARKGPFFVAAGTFHPDRSCGTAHNSRMALTATLHHFTLQIADMDRGMYADEVVRVARQPSETAEFMLVRVLAYALEYAEGIAFTEGVAAVDQPAVWVRDLTGAVTAWIEVGAPDAERVHRGSKLAGRAAVYSHRDPRALLAAYAISKIHRAAEVPVYSFDRDFLIEAAARLQRRSRLALTVTEQQLYLDIDGHGLTTPIRQASAAG